MGWTEAPDYWTSHRRVRVFVGGGVGGGGVPVNRLPGIFTEGRCPAPICADYFLKPRPGFNNSQLRAVRHLPSPVAMTTPTPLVLVTTSASVSHFLAGTFEIFLSFVGYQEQN